MAWAWPMAAGKTQAILKYENQTADEAFDQNGLIVPIPEQLDESVSLFVERGVTSRFTLQGKLAWTRGSDSFTEFQGRGPVELGARYAVLNAPRTVVSLYAGAIVEGEGAANLELRFLAGRSGVLWKRPLFGEVQVARLGREGLPDETRIETTIGWEPRRRWLLLAQSYAGRAESGPMWLKSEWSVLHDVGDWRLQAGWRRSQLGIDSPLASGPVLAVWRTF